MMNSHVQGRQHVDDTDMAMSNMVTSKQVNEIVHMFGFLDQHPLDLFSCLTWKKSVPCCMDGVWGYGCH